MLLVTAIVGIVIVPAAYLLLPRAQSSASGRRFVAIAVLAPIRLDSAGFAYGEGSSGDVNAAFGYVAVGLQSLSASSARRSRATTFRCRSSRGKRSALARRDRL